MRRAVLLLVSLVFIAACDNDPTGPTLRTRLSGTTYYLVKTSENTLPIYTGMFRPDQYSDDRVRVHLTDVAFRFGERDTAWTAEDEAHVLWAGRHNADLSCCWYAYVGVTGVHQSNLVSMTYKASRDRVTIYDRNGQPTLEGYFSGDTLVLGDPRDDSPSVGYFLPVTVNFVSPGSYTCSSGSLQYGVFNDRDLRTMDCAEFNARIGPVEFLGTRARLPQIIEQEGAHNQRFLGVWHISGGEWGNSIQLWGRVIDSETILVHAVQRSGGIGDEWSGYGRLILRRQ